MSVTTDENIFRMQYPGVWDFIESQLDQLGINTMMYGLAGALRDEGGDYYEINLQHLSKDCGFSIEITRDLVTNALQISSVRFDFEMEEVPIV